jgi:UDP-N-acetylmuramate dehydrogenase
VLKRKIQEINKSLPLYHYKNHMPDILENISLKPFHTFGTEAKARWFVDLASEDDIRRFLEEDYSSHLPLLLLGGGSNILFSKDYEGTIARIGLKGIELLEDDGNTVLVRAMAGENWDEFVGYCVDNGWGGLENLSLIPGNAGTSPVQNIGAYGIEIRQALHSVEAIGIPAGEKRVFSAEECGLDYRDSIFKRSLKGKYIITAVTFRLTRNSVPDTGYASLGDELKAMNVAKPTIGAVREAVIRIRRRKLPDPAVIGNAGSFFKNPVIPAGQGEELLKKFPTMVRFPQGDTWKVPAGWLIEQCGWKGKRIGDAGVHRDQALIIVNHGNATGAQILDLARQIRESVQEKFGINLETEVNVIG